MFEIYRTIQETLVKNLAVILPTAKSMENVSYIYGKDLHSAGNISTTYIRYVNPQKPFVCLNENDGMIRISARGTRSLIREGLDLSIAIKQAAENVGGSGGGHNIASGGLLPPGAETVENFMKKLNEIIGLQLSPDSGESRQNGQPSVQMSGSVRFIDDTDSEKAEKSSEKLIKSLAPDNLYGMKAAVYEGYAEVQITSEKIGSFLATADDLLMNADGAVRVKKVSQKTQESASSNSENGNK
ncbi:MAG: DHHA1 domain-containing protein, partial [Methanimicrococcus sp.]|nr:DHHA1 domain-containing protein [Methanimicrococcus sp.]